MKSDQEITDEIARLTEMKPRVRHHSAFGDDNHEAIEFQIRVLEERMDNDDIYDELPDDEADAHIRTYALDALEWMNGSADQNAPSEDWSSLVS